MRSAVHVETIDADIGMKLPKRMTTQALCTSTCIRKVKSCVSCPKLSSAAIPGATGFMLVKSRRFISTLSVAAVQAATASSCRQWSSSGNMSSFDEITLLRRNHSWLNSQWIVDAQCVVLEAKEYVDMPLEFLVHAREIFRNQPVSTHQRAPVARQSKLANFAPTGSVGTLLNCCRGHLIPGRIYKHLSDYKKNLITLSTFLFNSSRPYKAS